MPVLRALCAAIFVYASANSALAQDWRFEPKLKIGGEYDDNATLDSRTDEEIELSGFLVDASANIRYASPTTSFFVQPRVLVRNYKDNVEFDSDDYFLRSAFRRQTKSSTVGFHFQYDQQSVRTGERLDSDLEIEDLDEITNDDTSRVLRIGQRTKWRVSPYWEYQLSKLSSIGVDFNYIDTQYDNVFAGILTDYTDARLGLNYRRATSEVTTWGISLTGHTYDSENLSEEINGYGLVARMEHALSEKTRVAVLIGYEKSDKSGGETGSRVVGMVRLTRDLETIRLFAEYRRSVYGSGAGSVSVRDSLNVNFSRRLSEKISAGLGVRAYQSDALSRTLSGQNRNYVQLQWNLVWYVSRSFVIEVDYRYTVVDRDLALGGHGNSNRVNLWFVYQPNTIPKI